MTRRSSILVIALALIGAMLVVAVGAGSSRTARARARESRARFAQVIADAERVIVLRASEQTVAAGEQPRQDVFRRVNDAIAACALSHVRVQSVSPAGDHALDDADTARRVQTVRIELESIAIADLGALLDRWRHDHALWTITGVELAAARTSGAYHATLTASAVYIADAAPSDAPARFPVSTPASTSP